MQKKNSNRSTTHSCEHFNDNNEDFPCSNYLPTWLPNFLVARHENHFLMRISVFGYQKIQ